MLPSVGMGVIAWGESTPQREAHMSGTVARWRAPILVAGAASAIAVAALMRERHSLRDRFMNAVAEADLPAGPGDERLVTEAEIAHLPDAVQRYLRFMGVVGRPRVWSFRTAWTGHFRLRPEAAWLPCEAWQYNTRLSVGRIFHIRIRFGGVLPVVGRDTYLGGSGRMFIRLFDRILIQDATGPAYDTSELVTYLNDALFLAPSMLLGPETTWTAVDDSAFDVTLTNGGRTVSGRVYLDERGAPRDFSTTDRFLADPYAPYHPLVRAEWRTPVHDWHVVNGRLIPAGALAVWHLPQGDFAYADLRVLPATLTYNVRPGPAALRGPSAEVEPPVLAAAR